MKQAKANDHWRRVYSKTYKAKLHSITIESIDGIRDSTVVLTGGVTALCGTNGTGKSTLLKAMHVLLDRSYQRVPHALHRLFSSSIKANLHYRGNDHLLICNIDSEGEITRSENWPSSLSVLWLEPSLDSPEILQIFRGETNLDELLEAYEPRVLTENERKPFNYVVGKTYNEITAYEIDEQWDRSSTPYFRVSVAGVTYGTENMGLGEFSAFYILWSLQNTVKDTFLLLEEPECYISPRAQMRLMNYIARYSEEMSLWTVITTHSPHCLQRIPKGHSLLLVSSGAGSELLVPTDSSEYLENLGLTQFKTGLVYVEDSAAKLFLSLVLRKYGEFILRKISIQAANSEQELVQLIRLTPRKESWPIVLGVLDGDARERNCRTKFPHPILYLPGDVSPEELLISVAKQELNELASRMDVNISMIHRVIANNEGKDHHDWIVDVARELNVEYTELFTNLFHLWLARDMANKEVCIQLAGEIVGIIN